jgi:hypothetical protein
MAKVLKTGIELPRSVVSSATRRGLFTSTLGYSLITAADEKIPLSVGHVNKKPQYLVFPLHSGHLVAKQGNFPVES